MQYNVIVIIIIVFCLICHHLQNIYSRNVHDLVTLPLEWVKVKCNYATRKATCEFLWLGNCNVCLICRRLWNIHSRNVYDLDLHLYSRTRPNVNMRLKGHMRHYMCWQLQRLSVAVCNIFTVKMSVTLTFRMTQVKYKYANRKAMCDSLVFAILMFVLPITICEIFSIEICTALTLTFRMVQGQL